MEIQNDWMKLKNLAIFKAFPEERLTELSKVLKPVAYKQGEIIFEEGSRGNSLFLVTSGEVKIEKRLDAEGREFKQLALFTEGAFFGEMALMEDQVRFARAAASADVTMLELEKTALFKWIEKQPVAAISFFVEMVRVISQRLRRTSSELTMLFDLSQSVLRTYPSSKDFLAKALNEIMLHMEGAWSSAACIYNSFNDEFEIAGAEGTFKDTAVMAMQAAGDIKSEWMNPNTYLLVLPGKNKPQGYMIFSKQGEIDMEERNGITIAFNTLSYLLSSALENIEHQNELILKERLEFKKIGGI